MRRVCLPSPGAAREPQRRERGSAGPQAGDEGGPGVTAAGREKSAFPISSPRFFTHPLSPFCPTLLWRLLGVRRVSSSAKWSPRWPRRGQGRVAVPRSRLRFHPGSFFLLAASARGEKPGLRSGPRGTGWGIAGPAGPSGLLPGLACSASGFSYPSQPRGTTEDPRPEPGRASRQHPGLGLA